MLPQHRVLHHKHLPPILGQEMPVQSCLWPLLEEARVVSRVVQEGGRGLLFPKSLPEYDTPRTRPSPPTLKGRPDAWRPLFLRWLEKQLRPPQRDHLDWPSVTAQIH